jgi:hypothetical protein
MKEYITIQIDMGITLKDSLFSCLLDLSRKGWRYKDSIINEPMDTVIIILEKG